MLRFDSIATMTVRRASAAVLLFVVVLAVGVAAVFRIQPTRGVQQRIGAIRAAGLPTTYVELDRWYPAAPTNQNIALLVLEAAGKIVPPPEDLPVGGPIRFDQETGRAFWAYLETNRPALEKLHAAAQRSQCRFPIDLSRGAGASLQHLSQVKSSILLLKAEAIYEAQQNHPGSAAAAIETGLAIGRALRAEPILISELVSVACLSITTGALEAVLNQTQLTEPQLSSLARSLAQLDAEGLPGLRRALTGERALGIASFRASLTEFEAIMTMGEASDGTPADRFRRLGYRAYAASGLRDRDLRFYLDMMDLLLASTQAGFPETLQLADAADRTMQREFSSLLGRLTLFSRMLLPMLQNAVRKEAAISARIRCAEVALAIERYRLDHAGSLLPDLAQLSPRYLAQLPPDPFRGNALQFSLLPNGGYQVTSLGAQTDPKRPVKPADASFTVRR